MARTNLKQALVLAAVVISLSMVSNAQAAPVKISVDGRVIVGKVIRLTNQGSNLLRARIAGSFAALRLSLAGTDEQWPMTSPNNHSTSRK
jgi:hypothetical protein